MNSLKKLTNEEYSFLNLMENLESKDVKSMCLVNKDFKSLCNQYLNSIYKKLLKRDFKIDVQNNKVYQILYDVVNGIYTKESGNVYLISFLYDQISSEQVFNNENISKVLDVIKFTKNPDIEDVNKVTPLMLAVSLNSEKYLKKILEYKPDINKRDINNFSILSHAINLKTKAVNSTQVFNAVLSLKPKISRVDVEDAITMLKVEDFKLFKKSYIEELKTSDVLYFALELCTDAELLRYIVKNFYDQFDKKRDIFEIMINNDALSVELVQDIFKEILRLNKINIKEYIKTKISEYDLDMQEERLMGFLFVLKDLINVNEIIEYIMEKTTDQVIETVFETYNDIDLNLNTNENKSIFKYLLESAVPLIVIKENAKIDYNELIRELIYIPSDVKKKEKYIQENNRTYLVRLKQKLDDLRNVEFTGNMFVIDLCNRLTIVLLIASLILNLNKEKEKILNQINSYNKNKTITDKIDLKYWSSII